MMFLAGLIGALGFVCILIRQTLLGALIGTQLLALGAAMIFVMAGASAGVRLDGHVFAFFISLEAIAQLVVGYAFAVRLFYLRNRVDMSELRSLKQ